MQQLATYRQTEVNTSDNVRVVSLLFDGALNFLRLARKNLKHGNTAAKGLYLGKATAIVGELSSCLNMEAGEVAQNLGRLYDFVLGRLVQANRHNDPGAFDEAERVLAELRDGWREMEQNISAEAARKSPLACGAGLRI